MAKFDFNKPVASFSWYLQNGSADDKRGNRLHVGTGQNAQIYSDRKLYEHVRANKENKTLVMAYLIISLLTIAQLATIIIFLNNLVQIFV